MTATRSRPVSGLSPRQPVADQGNSDQPVASNQLPESPDASIATSPVSLFGMGFGAAADAGLAPHLVQVPLRALGGCPQFGLWPGTEPGTLAGPDEHMVVHGRVRAGQGRDMAAATLAIYRELLARVRMLDPLHLVRIWNFVPDINDGANDDETYVQFNHGRAAAFDEFGVEPGRYPAATAVGSPAGSPLVVVILASRVRPVAIENPRQVSAYNYPRKYGPRAPAFARAMILPDRTGDRMFISGTSSIVGHQSQHLDVQSQLTETLANLDQLIGTVTEQRPGSSLGTRAWWRVYLRDPADMDLVMKTAARRLPGKIEFVQADICRRELHLEIEGVSELAGPGASHGD